MQILKEITEWESDFPIINKIYLLDLKDNIIAYSNSDNSITQLKSPIKLDKRRRKFIKVNDNRFSKLIQKDNNNRIFKVKSKDNEYTVSLDNNNTLSCTCTGFTFRGKCKHIEAVRNTL